jgi:hypothetical protein
MATSDLHQSLVRYLLQHIESELGTTASVFADLGAASGIPKPPVIANSRPDALARCTVSRRVIIAEAKTRRDIIQFHTESQLTAYFAYLAMERIGELWLAVPWAGVDEMFFTAVRSRRLAGTPRVPFKLLGIDPTGAQCIRTVQG